MGGSGDTRGGRSPDVGGSGEAGSDCTLVRFFTNLLPTARAGTRSPGDVLEICRVDVGGNPTVAAIAEDGSVVGTVLEEVARLLRCMATGFAFVAELHREAAGVHTVLIRPASVAEAAGSYTVATAVVVGVFELELSDPADIATDVVAGPNVLGRVGICELRSLLRAAARFEAHVDSTGFAAVEAAS